MNAGVDIYIKLVQLSTNLSLRYCVKALIW